MDISEVWEELVQPGGRIVYLVLDGAGGVPDPDTGKTAYGAADIPNLDRLASQSSCGLLEIVGPGITPGSGPGHLALFGYDPLRYRLGRGVLSALGIDFDLQEGDVAARANFAHKDGDNRITDRRAGRIPTDVNRSLCERIRDAVHLDFEGEHFFETVSEHRAVLVLRGAGLGGDVNDTDPQATGVAAARPEGRDPDSERTAALVRDFLAQADEALAGEERANTVLLRGFERYRPLPGLSQRFGLEGLCLAGYPMYRGVSRLLGMALAAPPEDLGAALDTLEDRYGDRHGLYFLHVKDTDKKGEDADFRGKVAAIEEVDRHLPRILDLRPEVLVVTSDHSSPAAMGSHSWHPVPVLIHSRFARPAPVAHFDELHCASGSLGIRPGLHLMGLALAHAGRLRKFGA